MAFMGMGMGAASGAAGGFQQPAQQHPGQAQMPGAHQQQQGYGQAPPQQGYGQQAPPQQQQQPPAEQGEDPVAKLGQLKQMLDQGLITNEDYEAAKAKVLGL